MNTKNRTHYYLRINKKYIIYFDERFEFENMTDYITLNVFTGLFQDKQEMIDTLRGMQLISETLDVKEIDVVKRVGNKQDGYSFEYVPSGYVNKNQLPLLSPSVARNFFTQNIDNYEVIADVLISYLDEFKEQRANLEESIKILASKMSRVFNPSDIQKVKNKLNRQKSLLARIQREEYVINRILGMTKQVENGEFCSSEFKTYHDEKIAEFIAMETQKFYADKSSLNKSGLIKLTKRIYNTLQVHSDAQFPLTTIKYNDLLKEFQRIIESSDKGLTSYAKESLDEIEDPDTFMFLEEEDYKNLGRVRRDPKTGEYKEPSKETLESIESAVEELTLNQEKQGKRL